ncbi:MAG: ribose-5-phosphate isomerase RpiA [Candidatus Heimdallarchaeota archaeon]|nr:ribose-5-phosphate isomerase RpiA [Candidatus Heimdallarchaeota archaeon]MCK4611357.1 ribose-5-phosphate isomerase RpiA [Candidatus Heimdallarchaeota archaeon]
MNSKDSKFSDQEKSKFLAAQKAAKEFIYDGFVVGVGTGSTVKYFIQQLGELVDKNELEIITIPSSAETHLELVKAGLPVSTLLEYPEINIYVDGADIITKDYVMIKGGGGALTLEKIIARASQEFLVIADSSKYPRDLLSYPVPVEIIKQAIITVLQPIFNLGGELQLRYGTGKKGPVITDNGNIIGDITFKREYDPFNMEMNLNNIAGIVENGLFPSDADKIIIGKKNSAKLIKRGS